MPIGVVIVTYNRKEKLAQALELYDRQTVQPAYVLVVDNASTDGTEVFLRSWQARGDSLSPPSPSYRRYVVRMPYNAGGSGGFHEGLERACKLEAEAEWVWVSDDDAFPEQDALEQAQNFLSRCKGRRVAAVCGMVLNHGSIDLMHRRRLEHRGSYIKFVKCAPALYQRSSFGIDLFSYVGTILSVQAMKETGTTNKDFFVWFDDSDHSLRLRKVGKIYCVPGIRIRHDTAYAGEGVTWKNYYGIRNEIYSIWHLFDRKTSMVYLAAALARSVKRYLLPGTHVKGRLELCGILDGRRGRLGIHPVYRPGWEAGRVRRKAQ